MKLVELQGVTFIEGGVCAAKGFKANGVQCGLAHKPLGEMEEANAKRLAEEMKKVGIRL